MRRRHKRNRLTTFPVMARPESAIERRSQSCINPLYHSASASVDYSINKTDGKALDASKKQIINTDAWISVVKWAGR